jgi:hypothetical protein
MAVYSGVNGETSKSITPVKTMPMTGGGASADSRGGSSRSYPKSNSLPGTTDNAPFNPQKVSATSKYVGGI